MVFNCVSLLRRVYIVMVVDLKERGSDRIYVMYCIENIYPIGKRPWGLFAFLASCKKHLLSLTVGDGGDCGPFPIATPPTPAFWSRG